MEHTIFEYLYRDAGNFKTWSALLLEGAVSAEEIEQVVMRLDGGEFFIAEQLGIPALCAQLWAECDAKPSAELDHVWHQFGTFRPATHEELASLPVWGSVKDLLTTIAAVVEWDISLSPNLYL